MIYNDFSVVVANDIPIKLTPDQARVVQIEPTNMTPHYFIGIDRSDYRLDLCILAAKGKVLEQTSISTDPEAMLAWVRKIEGMLPAGARAALCIEQPCPGLLNFFKQFDFLVLYLINPLTLKRYREAFNPSRAIR